MKSPSRLLPVLSPYAEQIVKGEKVWELRSTNTQVRERVGIALVGTKTVIGDVRVVDSREVSRDELREYQDLHRVTPESIERMFSVKKKCFAWILELPREYPNPVPYEHPQGAIVWIQCRPLVGVDYVA